MDIFFFLAVFEINATIEKNLVKSKFGHHNIMKQLLCILYVRFINFPYEDLTRLYTRLLMCSSVFFKKIVLNTNEKKSIAFNGSDILLISLFKCSVSRHNLILLDSLDSSLCCEMTPFLLQTDLTAN